MIYYISYKKSYLHKQLHCNCLSDKQKCMAYKLHKHKYI